MELITKSALEYFEEGNDLEKQNKWSEAAIAYQKATELEPKSAQYHSVLAKVLSWQGKWQETLTYYQKASQLNPPDSYHINHHIGFALSRVGRDSEAIDYYKKSIKKDEKFIWSHYQLGLALNRQCKWQESLEYLSEIFEKNLNLRPDFSSNIYQVIGTIFEKLGKIEEAIKAFKQSLSLQVNNSISNFRLGLLLADKKQWQEALACYQKAVESNPVKAKEYSQLERLLIESGLLNTNKINIFAEPTSFFKNATKVNKFSIDKSREEYITIAEQNKIKVPVPLNLENSIPIGFMKLQMSMDHLEPNYNLVKTNNCKVFAGPVLNQRYLPYIIKNNQYYLDIPVFQPIPKNVSLTSDNQISFPIAQYKKRHLPGKGFMFTWSSSSVRAHSHWLMQTLPRVDLVGKFALDAKLMVIAPPKKYQLETFEILGFAPEDIIIMQPDEVWDVDELYIAQSCADSSFYSTVGQIIPGWQEFYRYLASRVENKIVASRRIYVSRLDAKYHTRRFLNEEQVCKVMQEYGFDIIIPSDYTFAEEINVFRNADIIVGPMGSGIYNCVFSHEGAKLLVMTEERFFSPWPNHIAQGNNLEISYLIGESFLSNDSAHQGTINSWIVDLDLLRKVLDKILK